MGVEKEKLEEHRAFRANWKKWGPYLAERAWGTVREDLSADGDAWESCTHEDAVKRAYRWNEDGLLGISDRNQYLCFAPAIWNGKDPILKERLFGLNNREGNHAEDVKEYYYYLDSSPTHSYMKALYKYPQRAFPYALLREENGHRSYNDPEYELIDTDVFADDAYFDLFVEYAKASENDLCIRLTLINRNKETAEFTLLPQLWFRNTWNWGYPTGPMEDVSKKPVMRLEGDVVAVHHPVLGHYYFHAEGTKLFTENETGKKDAFHRFLIHQEKGAVNRHDWGTKVCSLIQGSLQGGEEAVFKFSLNTKQTPENVEEVFKERKQDCDAFYKEIQNPHLTDDERNVQRQAFAGMLWSKQLYYYDLVQWRDEVKRTNPRNQHWENLVNFDVISMPDTWEYPWYASWDLAFHCIPLSLIDPDFAKRQLVLMTREWYMHTNGALPAYEWNFSDVNPPVHAWAAWRVYKIEGKERGEYDREFLEGIFHKLLLNFTWWVNQKDAQGNNIFQGGFLGLDNISLFDRSAMLPDGGRIDQSDGTAWMGFYCVLMMRIALELAKEDPIYQDSATKFFEHFLRIQRAMTSPKCQEESLWCEKDGFFYDALSLPNGNRQMLKVRSLVGLLALFPVEIIEPHMLETMPVFHRRLKWFIGKHPTLQFNISSLFHTGENDRWMLAFLTKERLERVLKYMLDENEFLSPYGIRSVSKYHEQHPYQLDLDQTVYEIDYEPAESTNKMFGGNSNWRGPVWFPINFLIIESLQKYHHYYGDSFKVEFPTGSGHFLTLADIATELSKRLNKLFLKNESGQRPIYGNQQRFQTDPHWKDYLLFNEYFHGDTGYGLGASHQTGWTGLAAKLLQQSGGKP
ncbi:MAG: glucosidase [Chlamydiia bacterium]|nr:glucosidase [Chlamydiia bacterium]